MYFEIDVSRSYSPPKKTCFRLLHKYPLSNVVQTWCEGPLCKPLHVMFLTHPTVKVKGHSGSIQFLYVSRSYSPQKPC